MVAALERAGPDAAGTAGAAGARRRPSAWAWGSRARPSGTACGRGWPGPAVRAGPVRAASGAASRAGSPGRWSSMLREPDAGRAAGVTVVAAASTRRRAPARCRPAGSWRRQRRRRRSRRRGAAPGTWTAGVGGGSGSAWHQHWRGSAPLRRVGRPCFRRRRVTVPVRCGVVSHGPYQYPGGPRVAALLQGCGVSRRCRRPRSSDRPQRGLEPRRPRALAREDVRRLLDLLVRLRVGHARLRRTARRVARGAPTRRGCGRRRGRA